MAYQIRPTQITYALDEKGQTEYVEVALLGTEPTTNGYASTRVQIMQADLSGAQTFDNLNRVVIVNLALKLSRNYFTNDALTASSTANTADNASAADTTNTASSTSTTDSVVL